MGCQTAPMHAGMGRSTRDKGTQYEQHFANATGQVVPSPPPPPPAEPTPKHYRVNTSDSRLSQVECLVHISCLLYVYIRIDLHL